MVLTGIALRIYGGSQTGGLNQTPIVSIGSLQEPFVPQPPTLVDEEKSWIIIHAQDYTAYALHTKEYNTQEGLPGQLLICLLLPSDQRLDDKDPFSLLNTIQEHFAVQTTVDGKLPTTPVDSSSYANLLKQYKLTKLARPLPVMKGNKAAAFQPISQAQLIALMRYSNYPVLTNISRLEIGMRCQSTIAIPMGGSQPQRQNHPNLENLPKEEKEKPRETVQPSKTTKTIDEDWIPEEAPKAKRTKVNVGKKKKWLTGILGTVAIAGLVALLWYFIPFGKTTQMPQEQHTKANTVPEVNNSSPQKETVEEDTKKEEAEKEIERETTKEEEGKRKTAVTSFVSDGIEYKYADPTTSQLQEWRKKYHSVCSRKISNGNFDIPKEMMVNHPCLVYLVLNSKSLEDDKERQSWFDLYPLMNTEQINKLYKILYREKYKLEEINYRHSNK